MNDRTVKISLAPYDGSPAREIEAGENTVTLYAEYGDHKIVVMPDVHLFRFNVVGPGNDIGNPLVVLEINDDCSMRLMWNRGEGSFKISEDELGVVVTPVPGKVLDSHVAGQAVKTPSFSNGDRVKLVRIGSSDRNGDPGPVAPGSLGTVICCHQWWGDRNSRVVSVNWDNGHTLSVVMPTDEIVKLEGAKP